MAGLDPAAIAKIVASLDAEIARRRDKKDASEDARWAAAFNGDDVILFAKRLAREWDRRKPGGAPTSLDRQGREALEDEVIELMGIAELVERAERHKEDQAAGIVRRPVVKVHVRSMGLKQPPATPGANPGALKVERTGRRGAAPMIQPDAPEERWLKGMVMSFSPRDNTGMIRTDKGEEFPLAVGCLMRSGLVSLIPGMRANFLAVGAEAYTVKAAWH